MAKSKIPKECVECGHKELTITHMASTAFIQCTKCKALMTEGHTKKEDYECDMYGNKL